MDFQFSLSNQSNVCKGLVIHLNYKRISEGIDVATIAYCHYVIGDCSFENGMCTWVNVRNGDHFDWTIRSGSTPSSQTGPSSDHNGDTTGMTNTHCQLI